MKFEDDYLPRLTHISASCRLLPSEEAEIMDALKYHGPYAKYTSLVMKVLDDKVRLKG